MDGISEPELTLKIVVINGFEVMIFHNLTTQFHHYIITKLELN